MKLCAVPRPWYGTVVSDISAYWNRLYDCMHAWNVSLAPICTCKTTKTATPLFFLMNNLVRSSLKKSNIYFSYKVQVKKAEQGTNAKEIYKQKPSQEAFVRTADLQGMCLLCASVNQETNDAQAPPS